MPRKSVPIALSAMLVVLGLILVAMVFNSCSPPKEEQPAPSPSNASATLTKRVQGACTKLMERYAVNHYQAASANVAYEGAAKRSVVLRREGFEIDLVLTYVGRDGISSSDELRCRTSADFEEVQFSSR